MNHRHEPPQDKPAHEAGGGAQRRSKALPFGLLRGLYVAPDCFKPDDAAAEKFISGASKPPAEPDDKGMLPTMIRMEKDLRDRIDAKAKANGMGRSAWIRFQCIRGLEES